MTHMTNAFLGHRPVTAAQPPRPTLPVAASPKADRPDLPAVPDSRDAVEKYIDAIAPSWLAGRLVEFTKDGVFATKDDGEPIDPAVELAALVDETVAGWIKFPGDGGPPERIQGLIFQGFVMPDGAIRRPGRSVAASNPRCITTA